MPFGDLYRGKRVLVTGGTIDKIYDAAEGRLAFERTQVLEMLRQARKHKGSSRARPQNNQHGAGAHAGAAGHKNGWNDS